MKEQGGVAYEDQVEDGVSLRTELRELAFRTNCV